MIIVTKDINNVTTINRGNRGISQMNPNKKIRRLQNLLYTSGMGTILFSLWNVIRSIWAFFDTLNIFPAIAEGTENKTLQILFGIIFFSIVLISVSLSIYIGRRAILLSLGKEKGNAYIILAIISVLISFISHIQSLSTLSLSELFKTGNIVMFVIDLTSNFILLEVIVFSILLKKMRG